MNVNRKKEKINSEINKGNPEFHNIILIGGGAACVSAATQLIRSNKEILLISPEIGGLIKNANLIENLVSFPEGITGEDFVTKLKQTIQKFKIPIIYSKVHHVNKKGELFLIQTQNKVYSCQYLIIGTGTVPKLINLKNELILQQNKYLFYNRWAFSDHLKNIPEKKSIDLAIIGGGDAAYDYALNLSPKLKTITIFQRNSTSKALPILQSRVNAKENIKISSGKILKSIQLDENTSKIQINLITTIEQPMQSAEFDYILIAIGRNPNISYLSEDLRKSFELNKLNASTSYPGTSNTNIWFIGDVRNAIFRQLAFSMADGIKIAMILNRLF